MHATATRTRAPAPPLLLALPELVHRLAEETVSESGRGFSYASIPVHAEPDVSRPSDAVEREAETVGDRVAAGLSAHAGHEGTPDATDDAAVLASRSGGPCRAPAGFRAALASGAPGTTVPQPARTRLESAFGRSFATVRLHRDARADTLTGAIGARAFTWGSAIHLSASAPSPDTPAGLRLLAHELTHVVQGTGRGEVRRAEALFFSTRGKQPYYEAAKRFHAAHGFPAAVEVSSVEEMLEHLVGLPTGLTRVRLVTHAVPSGIFLPLLRGGGTSLFQADMRLQSQGRLEGELATEHPHGRAAEPRGDHRAPRRASALGRSALPAADGRPHVGGLPVPARAAGLPRCGRRPGDLPVVAARPRTADHRAADRAQRRTLAGDAPRLRARARDPSGEAGEPRPQHRPVRQAGPPAPGGPGTPRSTPGSASNAPRRRSPTSAPASTVRPPTSCAPRWRRAACSRHASRPRRPATRASRAPWSAGRTQQPPADEVTTAARDALRDSRVPDRAEPAVARHLPGLLGSRRRRPTRRQTPRRVSARSSSHLRDEAHRTRPPQPPRHRRMARGSTAPADPGRYPRVRPAPGAREMRTR